MPIPLNCKPNCGPRSRGSARTQQTPITALVVSGMNDVLNSQGYTQAAWWNRIPPSAWTLMFIHRYLLQPADWLLRSPHWYGSYVVFLVMTLVVSISFFLIADIDSPRGGIIRVRPQNLDEPLAVVPSAITKTLGLRSVICCKRFNAPLLVLLVFKLSCLFKNQCVDAERRCRWCEPYPDEFLWCAPAGSWRCLDRPLS